MNRQYINLLINNYKYKAAMQNVNLVLVLVVVILIVVLCTGVYIIYIWY